MASSSQASVPSLPSVTTSAPQTNLGSVASVGQSCEYRNETVQGIITSWHKELEDDLQEFQKQSQRVSSWENILRSNTKMADKLADDVARLQAYQEEVARDCELIEQYQSDLNQDLSSISILLEEEGCSALSQAPSEDDSERENTFHLTEQLDQHLTEMENTLKKIVSDFNQARGSSGDSSSPINKIVDILSEHHNCLAWIESRARRVQRDLEQINSELSAQD